MCVDCVLTSPRITQVDPDDGPLSEVVLSQGSRIENPSLQGVRQGDPLSPMLCLLAMEPLHLLFKKAQDYGLLRQLSPSCDVCRVSEA
jgi:hypothetical protein